MRRGGVRSSSVVLDGYYGMRNAGDDAFCVVGDHVARTRWGVDRLYFTGRRSDLPVSGPSVRGLTPEAVRLRGEVRARAIAAMVRSRRVVHVGGSTFMHALTRHRDQMRLARHGLITVDAVGVSVGPFTDTATASRIADSLREFRSITLRDSASAERLAELDAEISPEVAFDVAVLLRDLAGNLPRPSADGRVLGVSLCAHEAERGAGAEVEAQRAERTIETVRRVATSTGCSVKLLVFNDHPRWGDTGLTERAAAELAEVTRVEVVTRTNDPRTLLRETAGCHAVLATRLHHAVFAYSVEVPFAVVAYQAKGRDFAAECRLSEEVVFGASGPDPVDDAGTVSELMTHPDRRRAGRAVADALERAQHAFPEEI